MVRYGHLADFLRTQCGLQAAAGEERPLLLLGGVVGDVFCGWHGPGFEAGSANGAPSRVPPTGE